MSKNSIIEFAVKALIIQDDRFLAMHKTRVNHAQFELPGGRMEFGETAEQTVQRELMEETSLQVEPLMVVDTWNAVNSDTWQITGIVYLCAAKGNVRLSDEHDRYEWFPIEQASFDRMISTFGTKMPGWDWTEFQRKTESR